MKQKYELVEEGNYGYVVVMQGRHKGETMYYDDDYSEASAIVYPGAFIDGYFTLPRRFLRAATELEELRHVKVHKKGISRYWPPTKGK